MNILLVGASGKLGSAVYQSLTQRGHTVLTASRGSGDVRVDLTDPASIADLYAKVGKLDAVASAAGVTPFKTTTPRPTRARSSRRSNWSARASTTSPRTDRSR